jgi:hypothetical protein
VDDFLVLWMLGASVAAVGQFFVQKRGGSRTNWGYSPGWQREIGFWNLGMITIAAQILLRADDDAKRYLARGLVLLSFLFGTNHAREVLRGGRVSFHALWTAANYITVILGVAALSRGERRGEP